MFVRNWTETIYLILHRLAHSRWTQFLSVNNSAIGRYKPELLLCTDGKEKQNVSPVPISRDLFLPLFIST